MRARDESLNATVCKEGSYHICANDTGGGGGGEAGISYTHVQVPVFHSAEFSMAEIVSLQFSPSFPARISVRSMSVHVVRVFIRVCPYA